MTATNFLPLVFLGSLFLISVTTFTPNESRMNQSDTVGAQAEKSGQRNLGQENLLKSRALPDPAKERYKLGEKIKLIRNENITKERYRRHVHDETVADANRNKTMEHTLRLLEEGNKLIQLHSNEDVVLVIGNTGAGKTTITQFVVGDYSKLLAYYADEDDTILIKDLSSNEISTSTIISKTIFPKLYIDRETQTAFYDCPGFSDTRNTTIEIVNSFFIKKVADSAKRIKIILVVNHNSLTHAGDRKDFLLLLKYTTDLLKNIPKYRNSIALVATKVDVSSGQGDFKILKKMANFLNRTKQDLNSVLAGDELAKAGQLIDALLTNGDRGPYSRLAFFAQPLETGTLDTIQAVRKRKPEIRFVIFNNIQFVATDSDSDSDSGFGYTLSDKAKLEIKNLADTVTDKMHGYFERLGKELRTYFLEQMEDPLTSNLPRLREAIQDLKNISALSFSLLKDQPNSNSNFLSTILTTSINRFASLNCNQCISPDILMGIDQLGGYLNFLEDATITHTQSLNQNSEDEGRKRDKWLQPLEHSLTAIDAEEEHLCMRLDIQVYNTITNISHTLETYFIQNLSNFEGLPKGQFQHILNSLKEMEAIQWKKGSETPSELIRNILIKLHQLDFSFFEEAIHEKVALQQRAIFLDSCKNSKKHSDSRTDFIANPAHWLSGFKNFAVSVRSTFKSVESAIESNIQSNILILTELYDSYYKPRFEDTYKDTKNQRRSFEKDLAEFMQISTQIENFTTMNSLTSAQFIPEIAANIANSLHTDNSLRTATEIKENIEKLEFLKQFSPNDFQRTERIENEWLEPFFEIVEAINSKLHNYFRQLNAKMENLMAEASSQLGQYYLDKFQQIKHNTVHVDTLKMEVIELLMSLKKTEELTEENITGLLRLGPLQLLRHIFNNNTASSPFQKYQQKYLIFDVELTNDLNNTVQCLELLETYNKTSTTVNKIENSQAPILKLNQIEWLNHFRKFLPSTKLKFKIVTDEIQSRIVNSFQNLAELMSASYAAKFEQLPYTKDSNGHLAQFNESLDQVFNTFPTIQNNMGFNFPNEINTNATLSNFLESIFNNITSIRNTALDNTKLKSILHQLRSLGNCIDAAKAYNYTTIPDQHPSTWLKPVSDFIVALNATVNRPISCSPITNNNENLAVFEGVFVRLSSLLSPEKDYTQCVSEQTETLVITALHTVYIDVDVKFNSSLNVAILAPHWVIQGERTINHNGSPGEHQTKSEKRSQSGRGYHGRPGLPGENGGNFFGSGLTLNYNRNSWLKILASGGDGGPGQDGADGLDGINGENVTADKVDYDTESHPFTTTIKITKFKPLTMVKSSLKCWAWQSLYSCATFWFNGTQGTEGKSGGNGGVGGIGGSAGLITLSGPSNFKSKFNPFLNENSHGRTGTGGKGGRGGKGGIHGDYALIQISPGKDDHGFVNGKRVGESVFQGEAPNGIPGNDSVFSRGLFLPPPPQTYSVADQLSTFNIYRHFARKEFENRFTKNTVQQFLVDLDDQEFSKVSSTLVDYLMDEFLDLESQNFVLKEKHRNYMSFYERFANKINKYLTLINADNDDNDDDTKRKNVLTYLYTACLSRINALDPSYNSNLVTDMTTYVDLILNDLKDFNKQSTNKNTLLFIQNITQGYTNHIEQDIDAAQAFISNEILPEIAQLKVELDSSVEKLIEEIVQLQKQILEDRNNLTIWQKSHDNDTIMGKKSYAADRQMREESMKGSIAFLTDKQNELNKKWTLQTIFKGVDMASNILVAIPIPRIPIVGYGLKLVSWITQKIMGVSEDTLRQEKARFTTIYNQMTEKLIRENLEKLVGFSAFLVDTENKLAGNPTKFQNLIRIINSIRRETKSEISKLKYGESASEQFNRDEDMGKLSQNVSSSQSFIKIKADKLHEVLNSTKTALIISNNNAHNNETSLALPVTGNDRNIDLLNRIGDDLRLMQLTPEFFAEINDHRAKLDAVRSALENCDAKLAELREMGSKVESEMSLKLHEFHNEIGSLIFSENKGQNVTFESPATVDITRWHISQQLNAMKALVHDQFTKNYEVDNEMTLTFQKLGEGLRILTQLQERIVHFHRESKLATFISKINSAPLEAAAVRSPSQSQFDSNFRSKVERLESIILSNCIDNQYQMILYSFKMSNFPFADYYLQNLTVAPKLLQIHQNLQALSSFSNNNSDSLVRFEDKSLVLVQELAKAMISDIQTIRTKLLTAKSTQNHLYSYLMHAPFYNSKSTLPFFVWEHKIFPLSMKKLLSGQNVTLNADVMKSPPNFDAIKFSRVDLKFRVLSKNGTNSTEEVETELKNELEYFMIHMTHMGNSAYRYDGEYYTIRSQPISFIFSFQKNDLGLPMHEDNEYKKMGEGDILLSPYATWKIQLIPFNTTRAFTCLEPIYNKIIESQDLQMNLELVGNGTYVRKGLGSSVLKLENHYQVDQGIQLN